MTYRLQGSGKSGPSFMGRSTSGECLFLSCFNMWKPYSRHKSSSVSMYYLNEVNPRWGSPTMSLLSTVLKTIEISDEVSKYTVKLIVMTWPSPGVMLQHIFPLIGQCTASWTCKDRQSPTSKSSKITMWFWQLIVSLGALCSSVSYNYCKNVEVGLIYVSGAKYLLFRMVIRDFL